MGLGELDARDAGSKYSYRRGCASTPHQCLAGRHGAASADDPAFLELVESLRGAECR